MKLVIGTFFAGNDRRSKVWMWFWARSSGLALARLTSSAHSNENVRPVESKPFPCAHGVASENVSSMAGNEILLIQKNRHMPQEGLA